MDNPERVRISRKVKASIREAEKNDTAEQKTLCKARPIVKTQKSNITRNYETEQPSQADVFDDSTDIPVTRPSALDTAADEKPRRIGRETKATIREDSADTHVTHPSALDTAGSEKPRRIVRETGTVSRDNNTDVSVAHPSALDTADVKPRRISRVSRTSILKDNADVPVKSRNESSEIQEHLSSRTTPTLPLLPCPAIIHKSLRKINPISRSAAISKSRSQ